MISEVRPFRDLIIFWLLSVKNNIDGTYATFVLFQRVHNVVCSFKQCYNTYHNQYMRLGVAFVRSLLPSRNRFLIVVAYWDVIARCYMYVVKVSVM